MFCAIFASLRWRYIAIMGIHDRDWYRADQKAKGRAQPHKDVTYNPRMFRRKGARDPAEPSSLPTWAIVLFWLAVFAAATFSADRYMTGQRSMAALERQLMSLKDCDFVASGPCMKIVPEMHK